MSRPGSSLQEVDLVSWRDARRVRETRMYAHHPDRKCHATATPPYPSNDRVQVAKAKTRNRALLLSSHCHYSFKNHGEHRSGDPDTVVGNVPGPSRLGVAASPRRRSRRSSRRRSAGVPAPRARGRCGRYVPSPASAPSLELVTREARAVQLSRCPAVHLFSILNSCCTPPARTTRLVSRVSLAARVLRLAPRAAHHSPRR